MTRKDYVLIAEALADATHEIDMQDDARAETFGVVVNRLGRRLEADNPRFDFDRFVDACNPTESA